MGGVRRSVNDIHQKKIVRYGKRRRWRREPDKKREGNRMETAIFKRNGRRY